MLKRVLIFLLLQRLWHGKKGKIEIFLTQALNWELNILKGRLNCKYIEWTSLFVDYPWEKSWIRVADLKTPESFLLLKELFKHLINRFRRVNIFSFKTSWEGMNISRRQIFPFFCFRSKVRELTKLKLCSKIYVY